MKNRIALILIFGGFLPVLKKKHRNPFSILLGIGTPYTLTVTSVQNKFSTYGFEWN